jgi:hypothetical protein
MFENSLRRNDIDKEIKDKRVELLSGILYRLPKYSFKYEFGVEVQTMIQFGFTLAEEQKDDKLKNFLLEQIQAVEEKTGRKPDLFGLLFFIIRRAVDEDNKYDLRKYMEIAKREGAKSDYFNNEYFLPYKDIVDDIFKD